MGNAFAETLESGRFVLTAEMECPRGASVSAVARQARAYTGVVDAVNCTDNSAAVVRMSPVAAAAITARNGLTPLVQLTCRDRNRIALQSDILGAAAVGAAAIICMTGDPPETGNQPDAKPVFDLSSIELIRAVCRLNEGAILSGDRLSSAPSILAGAVATPEDSEAAVENLRAKIEAGASLIQTQIGYDLEVIEAWLRRVRRAGLHERAAILIGVAPPRRLSIARHLHENVPGVSIPERIFKRLEGAADVEAEGVAIAAELLRELAGLDGVRGAHIMTFGWREGVARVVEQAEMRRGQTA